MPNVTIATTMWCELSSREVGIRREEELKTGYWKDLVDNGCKTKRFEDTYESAWKIICGLQNEPAIMVTQEMANGTLTDKTKAAYEPKPEIPGGLLQKFHDFFWRFV
jgi:hypothetical protein